VVTDNYLALALKTTETSARGNILPYLRAIGLIDHDGKPLELARAWRDDRQYGEVCDQIRASVYPEELIAVAPQPQEDRDAVARWFGNKTGLGRSAVNRMVAFYLLLSEGDVSKRPTKTSRKPDAGKKRKAVSPALAGRGSKAEGSASPSKPKPTEKHGLPGVHINIEIHISSDASPDQIDKIFESMSKHIYSK